MNLWSILNPSINVKALIPDTTSGRGSRIYAQHNLRLFLLVQAIFSIMEKALTYNRAWQTKKKRVRGYDSLARDHSYKLSFDEYRNVNLNLTLNMKKAALRLSPSIVAITVYSGNEEFFFGSGINIECEHVDGAYFGTVLSSATLIRRSSHIVDNISVTVSFRDVEVSDAQILGYNLDYNMVLIKVKSDFPLPTTPLRAVDDSFRPQLEKSFELRPHRNDYKVSPGEILMALGRSYTKGHPLMAAAGFLSIEYCKLNCQELLRVNCRISKSGIGGPMVNCNGDIIGLNFYYSYYTPFLPTNVIVKWLDNFKSNLSFQRPKLGLRVASLHTTNDARILESFIQKFPEISSGVLVEKIKAGFTIPEIQAGDVIVSCAGIRVESLLQLFDIVREKVSERVHLVVVRPNEGVRFEISIVLAENGSTKSKCWRLAKEGVRMRSL